MACDSNRLGWHWADAGAAVYGALAVLRKGRAPRAVSVSLVPSSDGHSQARRVALPVLKLRLPGAA
jgi:hypothetical protein